MCNNYFLFLNIFFLNYKRYKKKYRRREKEFFPMKEVMYSNEVIVTII